MALPHVLKQIPQRPSMWLSAVEFDAAVGFVLGFDTACCNCALVGFHEWLVVKLGYAKNMHWSELVLLLTFPEASLPRDVLNEGDNQKRAIESLFKLLEEFWLEREAHNGLRKIFIAYEKWLRSQKWYDHTSPDWIEP